MQETFADIFAEYYSLFRGQAASIPSGLDDREYLQGIRVYNNAIRVWERADGTLWRDLMTTYQAEGARQWALDLASNPAAPDPRLIITGGTLTYAMPRNMRKPPGKVRLYSGNGYHDVPVIEPKDVSKFTSLGGYIVFYGGANQGYIMTLSTGLDVSSNGRMIDFPYVKSATKLSTTVDPAAVVPECSDVNFLVQQMLASRYANARNGFGYKVAKADATTALANMRIENDSGGYDSMNVLTGGSGWGAPSGFDSGITL